MVSNSISVNFISFKRLKGCPTDILIFGCYLVICGKHSSILVCDSKLKGGSVISMGCSVISMCCGNGCLYFGTSKGKVYVCSEEQFMVRVKGIIEEGEGGKGKGGNDCDRDNDCAREDIDGGKDIDRGDIDRGNREGMDKDNIKESTHININNDINTNKDININIDINSNKDINNNKDINSNKDINTNINTNKDIDNNNNINKDINIKRYSNSLFMHFRSLKIGSCGVNSMMYCGKENGVVVGLANRKICLLRSGVALVRTFYGPKCPISYVCVSKGGLVMVIGTSYVKFYIFKKENHLSYKSTQGFIQCGGFYTEQRILVGTDTGYLLYFLISKSTPFLCKPIGFSITSIFLSKKNKCVLGTQNGFIYFFSVTDTDINVLVKAEVYGVVNFIKYFNKSYYVGCGRENRVGRWEVNKEYMNCVVRVKVEDKEEE
ncbi:hypothetical protein CWI38_1599p0040 [Hamiltosporidium tvaerminnensis]|uniref:Uncharacterized protein n=1 Tax=Hamiltosporidium tvaerminnensis TaxID=1176355 RepID=A0A4V2JX76_9MICR|nr:hypothetical protein CWI38_1599p0040 [Hamiltosporidium tvaerminnensis]